MSDVYKEATEAIQIGNYERSTVRLLYIFYETYLYVDLQDDVNALISQALQKASRQPLDKASGTLYKAMYQIMEGDLSIDEEVPQSQSQQKKGWFGKIFGK